MSERAPFGFNVLGCASGNFGESVVLRNTIRALLSAGYPVAVRNFDTPDGRSGQDHTYDDLYLGSAAGQPYAVNLFGFNPPTYRHLVGSGWSGIPFHERVNAVLPNWELDVLPPSWAEVFRAMDVVLTSSEFVADAVRRAIPDVRLMRVHTAVYLPEGICPDRARWGLQDDEVVFFCAFDVTSDMRRKNPWGAIEAFRLAFPVGENQREVRVRLLVKLNNASVDPTYAPLVRELEETAAEDPRITLVTDPLSYREALSLYASSDVFVSLHRAEGLGLVLMEAMSLGLPVIATAYSGNMDFTTSDNCALVDFTLVPVDALHHDYQDEQTGGGASWAEPSIESAAGWMVRLAGDPELRHRIGTRAAADMDARRQTHLDGEVFRQLQAFAETYDLSGPEHRAKTRRLKAIRRKARLQAALRSARGAVGRALRASGLRR